MAPSPVSKRLATLLTQGDGSGPWPGARNAQAWRPDLLDGPERRRPPPPPEGWSAPGHHALVGTRISARILLLAARWVATASATYARLGLGSLEARVLSAVSGGSMTSAQIGKALGVDRAAVCRSVQTLVERDYVTKVEGRRRPVALTPRGEALVGTIDAIAEARQQRLLSGFAEAELQDAEAMLGRLMLNMPDLVELSESGVFEDERFAPPAAAGLAAKTESALKI